MKSTKTWYWITTGLICALMAFSAVPNILNTKESIDFFAMLGYPAYLVPFLGWAKLLGVIALLLPGYPRLREWAYAGLAFDLIGALYSSVIVAPDPGGIVFMIAAIGVLFTSYYLWHRRRESPLSSAAPAPGQSLA